MHKSYCAINFYLSSFQCTTKSTNKIIVYMEYGFVYIFFFYVSKPNWFIDKDILLLMYHAYIWTHIHFIRLSLNRTEYVLLNKENIIFMSFQIKDMIINIWIWSCGKAERVMQWFREKKLSVLNSKLIWNYLWKAVQKPEKSKKNQKSSKITGLLLGTSEAS